MEGGNGDEGGFQAAAGTGVLSKLATEEGEGDLRLMRDEEDFLAMTLMLDVRFLTC